MLTLALTREYFGDNVEIDIKGNNYLELIDACFSIALYFSLKIFENGDNQEIEPITRFVKKQINKGLFQHSAINGLIHSWTVDFLFECCDETKSFLKLPQYSLFYWAGRRKGFPPENITFYRDNGTILLETIAHDEHCYVYLEEKEIREFIHLAEWEVRSDRPYGDDHYLPQF